jgi:serine/threonine-protein kinase HipA
VRDEAGVLCLAKFASRQDTRDIGAWELVAHRIAAAAGIVVPAVRALRIAGSPHTTFLARRFDRTAARGRLAFVSAMTLTQRTDGEAGASYLELVDLLQSRGADTQADCEQLFRRVVFSILIHNTDDHLRNHGFFIDRQGIRLAPAYDINPSVERRELSLAIDEVETACDVSIAMDACRDYGLSRREADAVLAQVRAAVARWRDEAQRLGIGRAEQALMAAAFAA